MIISGVQNKTTRRDLIRISDENVIQLPEKATSVVLLKPIQNSEEYDADFIKDQ